MLALFLFGLISIAHAQAGILDEEDEWGVENIHQTPVKIIPGQSSVEELKKILLAPEKDDFEYRIGPQDLLEIEVFQVPELNHIARVDSDGEITLPLLDRVRVGGKTVEEAENLIEERLKKDYLQNPHVTLLVKEYKSQTITVDGWVRKPGIYPLTGKMTFLQAIAMAQGMDPLADFDQVAVFRKKEGKVIGFVLSYQKVRSGQVPDPVLKNGDVIVVNRSGSKAAWKSAQEVLRSFAGWVILF